jgi:hypothetical protein
VDPEVIEDIVGWLTTLAVAATRPEEH